MPVDTCHPDYRNRVDQWRRCRDAVEGEDAVHDAQVAYLPKLTAQSTDEYAAYVRRAGWYGATGRTLDGMLGMVFRKAPVLEAPTALEKLTKDITLTGVTLDGLAREVLREVEQVGRVGLLVEYPTVGQQPASLAEMEARNLRPYVSVYRAEHIVNWKIARVNNSMQPVQVVLKETYEIQVDDFEVECKVQYRVLSLDKDSVYVQRVYREANGSTVAAPLWQEMTDMAVVPQMDGMPLQAIPFYPFGPEELSMRVQSPPLLDLVDVNFSHYRTTADLEHGAHFTGLPTPVLSGFTNTFDPAGNAVPIRIGSSQAIVSADPAARATYMEFSGTGLGALEKLLDRKEAQMAALGARMLAPEKAGVEASATLGMRHNGEDSVLGGTVKLVAYGMTEMLRFMATWARIGGEVSYTMNTEYVPAGLSAQDVTALVTAWQTGAISQQVLFQNLQRGEIIDADLSIEDMQQQIGDTPPPAPEPIAPPVNNE